MKEKENSREPVFPLILPEVLDSLPDAGVFQNEEDAVIFEVKKNGFFITYDHQIKS
jgi:hypothetical protein